MLRWEYSSYEGRTAITAATAEKSGIKVQPAQPGVIADEHEVQGLLTPIEGRVAEATARFPGPTRSLTRSEEHTSELQSLMRISYAVFCWKKKKKTHKLTRRRK